MIRRYRRHRLAPLVIACGAAVLLLALAAWLLMLAWARGGPQPVHDIVIAIPAPQPPASSGAAA